LKPHTSEEQGGRQPERIVCSMRSKGFQMLLNLLHAITDFVMLVTPLTIEELSDGQQMALVD
jgi:hypothetical protein